MSPPPRRIYFPVGSQLSVEEMGRFSMDQILQRDILDPRYSGVDPQFNWRDHLTVAIADRAVFREVVDTLDQFARTAEGQHVIRQAHAMQTFRATGEVLPAGQLPRDRRVDIRIGANNQFFSRSGQLTINHANIIGTEWLGQDGRYYDKSIQGTLFHELAHAADGLMAEPNLPNFYQSIRAENIRAVNRLNAESARTADADIPAFNRRAEQILERFDSAPKEYPIINITNRFMQRYFNEPPRALNHSRTGAIRDELPLLDLVTTQPHLGPDHSYDDIRAPALPRTLAPRQR